MNKASIAVPYGTEKPNRSITRIFRALGTLNTISVPEYTDIESQRLLKPSCKDVIDLAAARIIEIDNRMSAFKQDSDIGRINAGSCMVSVHEDTLCLLKKAAEFSRITYGVFDITSAPLTMLWKNAIHNSTVPGPNEIKRAKKLTGYENMIIDEIGNKVMLKKRCQRIDLGSIAKGYAADEVKRILLENGIKNAIINLGGNIIAMGTNPSGGNWIIGVQDPSKKTGEFLGTLELKNETAVTSGSNEQYFINNGVRYHHIIDPRTGIPANTDIFSVTLIGECSLDMDALSTAVFVLGIEKGMELIKKFSAQAIFVTTDRSVFITENLKHRFRFTDDIKNSGTRR